MIEGIWRHPPCDADMQRTAGTYRMFALPVIRRGDETRFTRFLAST